MSYHRGVAPCCDRSGRGPWKPSWTTGPRVLFFPLIMNLKETYPLISLRATTLSIVDYSPKFVGSLHDHATIMTQARAERFSENTPSSNSVYPRKTGAHGDLEAIFMLLVYLGEIGLRVFLTYRLQGRAIRC